MSSWWFGVPNWTIMFICFSTTLSSSKCCNNGIGLSFVSWRGSWNLQIYCPQFCGNQIVCWSHCLYSRDAAEHLCNFRILDRLKHSWLATAADIWNELPAYLILQGEASGWCSILKDVQRCVCTWLIPHIYVHEVYYSKKGEKFLFVV